jgi:outer membrane protein assembly factor BamD (BamD/ComL family)
MPATPVSRADTPTRTTPTATLTEITTTHGESVATSSSDAQTSIAPTTNSLAEQARGLARIQRLLDAGNTSEAIRQLEVSFSSSDYASLAEERDALYVQALFRSQRTSQANLWAKRFIQRYPNSPHVEKIRRLVEGK